MTEQQSSKPPYAIDSSVARSWELKANNIRLEELLAAYAQVHAMLPQELEWFTATNVKIGILYTYGLHPNASLDRLYDGIWKREYFGGGSVIVAYTEEPATQRIYVGVLWQRRVLHNPDQPVLGVPRGYAVAGERAQAFSHLAKQDVEQAHLRTALVELKEEMFAGKITPDMLHRLGPPTNSNNADVDTSGDGEGIYFYRVELPWSFLELDAEGNLVLQPGLAATEGVLEGIVQCQFRPLAQILDMLDDPDEPTVGCEFTEIAIGRLARFLQRKGYTII